LFKTKKPTIAKHVENKRYNRVILVALFFIDSNIINLSKAHHHKPETSTEFLTRL
jgi:hypothetical protein